jgi:hypothetical protein
MEASNSAAQLVVLELELEGHLLNLVRDRFSNALVFGAPTSFHCELCGAVTRFQLGRKNPIAFTPEIHAALDAASGPAIPWETDFTDFCCLDCERPIRVTHAIEEFAMSSYRYLPLKIYAIPPPINPRETALIVV